MVVPRSEATRSRFRTAAREDPAAELESVRGALDHVDSSVLRLLHRRMELVRRIGTIKAQMASGSWAPAREKEVLERLVRENRGCFPDRALKQIFREIFSISRQQERPIHVAYYGLPGSLTHAAALEQFGSATRYEEAASLEQAFDRVAGRAVDYAFVPLEVACEGIVSSSLEVFLRSDLRICAEYFLDLELVLASPGVRRAVREVFLQPQVYGLVREWMALNLGRDVVVKMVAGSREAGEACAGRAHAACITQPFTARHFGLRVLEERIPYGPTRRLRFLTGGFAAPRATTSDKTTIAFSVADRVGVLEQALRPFRRHKVNLSFLESYPQSKASPTVTFFADVLGHIERPAIAQAVAELRATCSFVRVLGSYPVFGS
jgi:chorismate mutase/prephenate dehydratase